MIICSDCGQEVSQNEIHSHMPDIFLNVRNLQYNIARAVSLNDGTIRTEKLSFNVPAKWVDWILYDCCGGSISQSGMYRLPGRIYEWCLAKMRGDEKSAAEIEKGINKVLGKKYE